MHSKNTSICAVVVNDIGQILIYTAQSTIERCEAEAVGRWGDAWYKMKELGAKVVQAELRIL